MVHRQNPPKPNRKCRLISRPPGCMGGYAFPLRHRSWCSPAPPAGGVGCRVRDPLRLRAAARAIASCSASNCGLCGCFNARFCSYDDTVRTLIFTGRPLRVLKTPYIAAWEDRQQDIRQLCARGTVPFVQDVEEKGAELMKERPLLMGQVGNVVITSEPNFRCV